MNLTFEIIDHEENLIAIYKNGVELGTLQIEINLAGVDEDGIFNQIYKKLCSED